MNTTRNRRSVALTVAGSDSGGGAGIQADLKTFHAFGVFGTSAVTAITAQNTRGVRAVHAVPTEMVRAQIDAIAEDLRPAALKSGMLATAELVTVLAGAMDDHGLGPYVLDPVMVAGSGDRLLEADAERAVATELVPRATVVTPNLHEARILVDGSVETLDEMRDASRELVRMGAAAALVKGGHLSDDEAVDVFWDGSDERIWRRPRIATRHTHGTGCTLSAACAAGLARGLSVVEAMDQAIGFTVRAIENAPGLGEGNGPVSHFVDTPFQSGFAEEGARDG